MLSHVRKSFLLPQEQYHTLKERALHPFRTRNVDVLKAVDDISLEIATGEFFGIVGRNGSGKSTLLKCLAGIYETDSGELRINGRLSPFIELGVGFNPELTARDNVIINAIMLGLTRRQARERYDQIVAFAELEEFMDLKLKNYSSGMQVRLAFSVAIQVDAETLLIDEVLAVGDAAFQQKCFDEFTRLKQSGRTIVFVTHDMGAVERFCDRAMLMERGRMVDVGAAGSIARQYNQLNFRRVREDARVHGGPAALRRLPVAEVVNAWFESTDGENLVSVAQGVACCIRLDVRFHQDTIDPIYAVALRDDLGHTVFAADTRPSYGPTGAFQAGELGVVKVDFENWLGPGRYRLSASVSRDGLGADAYDLRENISSIIVHATHSGGGVVDLPHEFEIKRVS
jgi:ABC-type polysaccharide/polyol phosphate transport system ATPase subunit